MSGQRIFLQALLRPRIKSVRRPAGVLAAALFLFMAGSSSAHAQSLAMATDRAGTTFNAIGTGIAKVISQHAGVNVSVRPFAGPDAWLPSLARNELQLGAVSAFSAWESYAEKGGSKSPVRNMRLLQAGAGSLYVGYIAQARSDIRSVKDLKGRRVASGFGGHRAVLASVESTLGPAGLTWSDVVQIPVVGIVDGIDALVAGRVDATWVSLGQPQVREAHVKVGVRYLPLEDSPRALELMRKIAFPGAQIAKIPAGAAPGVEAETPMMTYDAYLVATEQLSGETVRKLLTALWDHNDELTAAHRALKGFTREAAVTQVPVIPYHPAAIAFYKEKGVWSEAAEKANASAAE